MNIVGIIVGMPDEVQENYRDISDNKKMKFFQSVFLLTILALDITIILLIANHCSGKN